MAQIKHSDAYIRLMVDNVVRLYDGGLLSDKEAIDLVMKIVWNIQNEFIKLNIQSCHELNKEENEKDGDK